MKFKIVNKSDYFYDKVGEIIRANPYYQQAYLVELADGQDAEFFEADLSSKLSPLQGKSYYKKEFEKLGFTDIRKSNNTYQLFVRTTFFGTITKSHFLPNSLGEGLDTALLKLIIDFQENYMGGKQDE